MKIPRKNAGAEEPKDWSGGVVVVVVVVVCKSFELNKMSICQGHAWIQSADTGGRSRTSC